MFGKETAQMEHGCPMPPEADLYLFNTGEAQQAYREFGCHYIPEADAWRFLAWAPNAKAMSVVGDFNRWDTEKTPMSPLPGGFWCAWVSHLQDGDIYKLAVTGADGQCRL